MAAKDGKIDGKHGASVKDGKPAWFKFDTDFAVKVETSVSVRGMTGTTVSGGRRVVKRAAGGEFEEAFDLKVSLSSSRSTEEVADPAMKVPGCKPNTEIDLEFGIGEAKVTGAWSAEAAKVTVTGSFGKAGGPEVGKYTLVFKTLKDVDAKAGDKPKTGGDSKTSSSGTGAPSSAASTPGAEGASGASKANGVTSWAAGVVMAGFAVMML